MPGAPAGVPATRRQSRVHRGAEERLSPDDQPPGHAGAQRERLLRVRDDQNPTFGYVQFGPSSPALGFVPKSFGTWTVKGAAEFLFLGDTLKPLNDNDVFKPIGRIGIAAVYRGEVQGQPAGAIVICSSPTMTLLSRMRVSLLPCAARGGTSTPVHNLRRVLLSHALIPIREDDIRTIAMHEHGHDRLGEMLNASKTS